LEDVMYIGDAGNDLVALAIVGHPVAMADASPAVKQAARRIIGRAQDGAVAEALEIALASWA
ncbi:MAG: haloacid dehalogenase-like hydrolase, partial [Pseudomonadota bacterium]